MLQVIEIKSLLSVLYTAERKILVCLIFRLLITTILPVVDTLFILHYYRSLNYYAVAKALIPNITQVKSSQIVRSTFAYILSEYFCAHCNIESFHRPV